MEEYVATRPAAECGRFPQKNRLPLSSRTIATTDSPGALLSGQLEPARAIEQFVAGRPQAGGRRRDEIESLAVSGRVPALLAFAGLITIDRLAHIGIAEIDAFDFRLFHMTGRVRDRKSAFARTVH